MHGSTTPVSTASLALGSADSQAGKHKGHTARKGGKESIVSERLGLVNLENSKQLEKLARTGEFSKDQGTETSQK